MRLLWELESVTRMSGPKYSAYLVVDKFNKTNVFGEEFVNGHYGRSNG